jgi:hypothetical protein
VAHRQICALRSNSPVVHHGTRGERTPVIGWQAGPASDGEYPVVLDGRRLFTIKAPRAPYNTQQRAKNISDDLLAVAEDEQVSAADMRIVPLQTDSLLLAGQCLSLRSPMRMGNACVASQIASGQHGRHRRI